MSANFSTTRIIRPDAINHPISLQPKARKASFAKIEILTNFIFQKFQGQNFKAEWATYKNIVVQNDIEWFALRTVNDVLRDAIGCPHRSDVIRLKARSIYSSIWPNYTPLKAKDPHCRECAHTLSNSRIANLLKQDLLPPSQNRNDWQFDKLEPAITISNQ